MKALYLASVFYLVLGLGAGVFYREFTRANDFPAGEFTQLSVAHPPLDSALHCLLFTDIEPKGPPSFTNYL